MIDFAGRLIEVTVKFLLESQKNKFASAGQKSVGQSAHFKKAQVADTVTLRLCFKIHFVSNNES